MQRTNNDIFSTNKWGKRERTLTGLKKTKNLEANQQNSI